MMVSRRMGRTRKLTETRRRVIRYNLVDWAGRQNPLLNLTFDQVNALTEAIFYGNTIPLGKGVRL